MTDGRRVDLEEALRLAAAFSALSADGEVPGDTPVPVPRNAFGAFEVRAWEHVEGDDREAFRRFYGRVGGALEGVAEDLRDGADIDDADWAEITRGIREAD